MVGEMKPFELGFNKVGIFSEGTQRGDTWQSGMGWEVSEKQS